MLQHSRCHRLLKLPLEQGVQIIGRLVTGRQALVEQGETLPCHRALNGIEAFLFLNQHPQGLAAGGVPGLKFTNGGLAGGLRGC